MKIVQATVKHLPSLVPLFDGYRIFYRQASNTEAAKTFLKERLEKKDTIILIAFLEDEAVGFTQLFYSFSSVSMQPMFILNDLFVVKQHRKKGIGVALLNKAKEFCKQENYKGLALETEVTNPAQHLYESLNWKKNENFHYFWANN